MKILQISIIAFAFKVMHSALDGWSCPNAYYDTPTMAYYMLVGFVIMACGFSVKKLINL